MATDEFVCAACGEKCSGEPYRVAFDVVVGCMGERQSVFASDTTYAAYCERCANSIAWYVTKRVGLQRLNRGSLTDRRAKLDAERRMADIGRKMWMTDRKRGGR